MLNFWVVPLQAYVAFMSTWSNFFFLKLFLIINYEQIDSSALMIDQFLIQSKRDARLEVRISAITFSQYNLVHRLLCLYQGWCFPFPPPSPSLATVHCMQGCSYIATNMSFTTVFSHANFEVHSFHYELSKFYRFR